MRTTKKGPPEAGLATISPFGIKLKSFMEKSGYSYRALSLQTGLSISSLNRYMHGTTPRFATLKVLADCFGVSPDDLLNDEDAEPTKKAPARRSPPGRKCPIVRLEQLRGFFLSEGKAGSSGVTEVPGGIEADGLIAVPVEESDESVGIQKGDTLFVRLGSFFRNGDLVVVNREKGFVVGKVSVDPAMNVTLTARGESGLPFALGGADKVVALLRFF